MSRRARLGVGALVRFGCVSLDDWILALHLLAAFAFVAALIGFWGMIAAGWNARLPREVLAIFRLSPFLQVLIAIGGAGTIVFGIWLAISLAAYHPWDGWVIAAIVLWALSGAAGGRAGPAYDRARSRADELASTGRDEPSDELTTLIRTRQGLVMHSLATLTALLLLVDMIWKPGA
jgi:hypothetical protein